MEWYDAMEGTASSVRVSCSEKECLTEWEVVSYAQDSFLYCLKSGNPCAERTLTEAESRETQPSRHAVKIPETVSVSLEEPNVLVLDMAEFRLAIYKSLLVKAAFFDNLLRPARGYAKMNL